MNIKPHTLTPSELPLDLVRLLYSVSALFFIPLGLLTCLFWGGSMHFHIRKSSVSEYEYVAYNCAGYSPNPQTEASGSGCGTGWVTGDACVWGDQCWETESMKKRDPT